MKHYLMSLMVPGGCLHGYFMASNKEPVQAMCEKLLQVADDHGVDIMMPMVLVTPLSKKSTKKVRDLVVETSPDHGATLRAATDFHVSIFGMAGDNPANTWLMDLH